MVAAQVMSGASLVLTALRPSLAFVTAGLFPGMLPMPVGQSSNQAIRMSKTPRNMPGRAFAIRRMVALPTLALAALAAGPLGDRVFNPLLMPGGAPEHSVGRVLGVGPGRGSALMFLLIGGCTMACTALLYASPRVRRLESEVPDAAPVHPAAPEPAPAPQPAAAGA